ncbi:hypothetical protein [Sphingopyxis sp. LC81]|uniref:hypothetical protein n=1 Tax=Sphingopyxis sp. LC81 TaxID=1502850 RepID=UPI000ABC3811|nr:hypothetical protein [Sphingopyxis sp. LC81]
MSAGGDSDFEDDYYVSLLPTEHFNRFWEHQHKVTQFGHFVSRSLVDSKSINTRGSAFDSNYEALEYNNRLLFTRILDNFQTFVTEIISACMQKNPKMLGAYTLKAEILFQYDDLGELRKLAVEQMATKFSYMNIADLDDELRSRFGFPLFERKITKLRIKRLVEIRNAIVHNRGLKSSNFVKRVGAKVDRIGDEIAFAHPADVGSYIERIAEDVDQRAKLHFGLEPEHDS